MIVVSACLAGENCRYDGNSCLSLGFDSGTLESGLQDQIFGRIAHQKQLGKDDEIGAGQRGLATRVDGFFEIACNIAHGGVQLSKRDAEFIGHLALNPGVEPKRF